MDYNLVIVFKTKQILTYYFNHDQNFILTEALGNTIVYIQSGKQKESFNMSKKEMRQLCHIRDIHVCLWSFIKNM